MAHVPNFVLKVEIDQERLAQLQAAEARFSKAVNEIHESTEDVRAALRAMRESLTVQREVDNGHQDPGLERRDGQA